MMSDSMSRRHFAERLALAAAAPFIALDLRPVESVAPVPAPAPPLQQSEPSPLARALAEAIRLRYGDRLSGDDLKTLTTAIDGRLQGLERLSRVALTNADEPDFVFAAYRAPEP
jgi:hypothetical protein